MFSHNPAVKYTTLIFDNNTVYSSSKSLFLKHNVYKSTKSVSCMNFKTVVSSFLASELSLDETTILSLLEKPPEPSLGDIAFPCFILAKKEKKAPAQIAQALAEQFKPTKEMSNIKAVGPYVNFFATKGLVAEQVLPLILSQKETYGKQPETQQTVAVEFFSPNTHKAVHIGHIRNISFGEALARIFEVTGNKVIRLNYPSDVGPHIAKCLWLMKKQQLTPPTEDRSQWLAERYAEANNIMKTDENAEKESRQLLHDLYAEEPEVYALWKKTRQWCVDEFEQIAKEFDVSFDKVFFESEMEVPARMLAKQLLKEHIAEESDGAIILDLERDNLGAFVILTSDARALYSSKDLVLAQLKFKQFSLNESFYIVGKEQERHFQQVFASLRLMGKKKISEHSHHLPYELVSLSDGSKMSSREGNVVFYSLLKEELMRAAKSETKKRHTDWSEEKITTTATALAFSAMKFQMINRDNNKKILFNSKQALDFEGETGAYVLYTYARLCSLFKKNNQEVKVLKQYDSLNNEEENILVQMLQSYPEVLLQAGRQHKPLLLSRFVLALSQQCNRFYHLHPVLQAEQKVREQRLALCKAVQVVIKNVLDILALPVVEEL